LQIEVQFICPEIVGPLRSGAYDVPENTTISELLEISSSECSCKLSENVLDYLLFLLNGKSAQPDAKLTHGDKLYVLRTVFGG
jgi:sulfur carrier protein ThiS